MVKKFADQTLLNPYTWSMNLTKQFISRFMVHQT